MNSFGYKAQKDCFGTGLITALQRREYTQEIKL